MNNSSQYKYEFKNNKEERIIVKKTDINKHVLDIILESLNQFEAELEI